MMHKDGIRMICFCLNETKISVHCMRLRVHYVELHNHVIKLSALQTAQSSNVVTFVTSRDLVVISPQLHHAPCPWPWSWNIYETFAFSPLTWQLIQVNCTTIIKQWYMMPLPDNLWLWGEFSSVFQCFLHLSYTTVDWKLQPKVGLLLILIFFTFQKFIGG